MSEKDIDLKIKIGTEYDGSGVDRANEDLARLEQECDRKQRAEMRRNDRKSLRDELRQDLLKDLAEAEKDLRDYKDSIGYVDKSIQWIVRSVCGAPSKAEAQQAAIIASKEREIKRIKSQLDELDRVAREEAAPKKEEEAQGDIEEEESESSYNRRKEEAAAMAEAGATHDEIRAETGIELVWNELQKARSAYVKSTSVDIEELKREKEHYIRLRREELELKKARGEISKEDYDYGKRKIAMEEELYRVEIREHEAKLKLIEAQYDALHKRVQAGKSGKEKDALIAQEKLLEAELAVELASAHAKREKERQAEADASAASLRDAKKKAREERETAKNREKEAKAQRQNEAEQQRRKKRLKSLANVDLQHEYKQAKKKAKKARKGGDEKEIEEAEAEVQLYKAETKRRRRHKKAKKIRDKVEKKMPVVVDPKEIANIEEAMGILGQVERDEKLNGLGVEQLVGLMKRAQETRSKRDDQLVSAIMQLVQVEENAGAKVMKELERLKRKTHKLQETAFN